MSNENSWFHNTNVYEVNLRQYTPEGTIVAFSKHLPRLKDMGIETLWFMPVTPIAQKNKKGSMGSYYACSDYTSVSAEFGSMEDWKQLVSEAHDMGFKVILDWVANHTGWDHRWTWEHPEWYRRDEHTGDFKKASGMDDIIELNFDLPEVRRAMINAMKFWIDETGIDGFRCDLAYWVQLDFWLEAKLILEEVKPLFWLGELDSLDNPEYMQVFDAAYTWRWMHKAEHFYKQNLYIGELVNVLEQYQQAPGSKAWFTSNHDENSWNGTEYEKYGEMAQALAVFSCTWPGVPLIYSGQELPNHKRLQFFEKDIIEWKEHFQLHDFYKKLLTFKQETPALSALAPVRIIQTNAGDKLLTFSRGQNEVIVMINFSGDTVNVQLDIEPANYTDLFSGEKFQLTASTNLNIEKWGWMIICS